MTCFAWKHESGSGAWQDALNRVCALGYYVLKRTNRLSALQLANIVSRVFSLTLFL